MTAGEYLFGFTGRINRAKWWLLLLIQIGAVMVYYMAIAELFATSILSAISNSPETAIESATGSGLLLILLSLAYFVGMFVVWLAVTVKRLHDRDKSGGWIWLFALGPWVADILALAFAANHSGFMSGLSVLAGMGISIWAFIELGCLRGTIGDNRFGPDPLAPMHMILSQWPPANGAYTPAPAPNPVRSNHVAVENPVRANPAADGATARVSPAAHASLELSGIGRFSEYYMKIDAAELTGMAGGLLVGRDPEACAFVIDDSAISRKHARLSTNGSEYLLEDLGSTNRTTVNERVLVPHQPARLRSGDRVTFGSASFNVQLR